MWTVIGQPLAKPRKGSWNLLLNTQKNVHPEIELTPELVAAVKGAFKDD